MMTNTRKWIAMLACGMIAAASAPQMFPAVSAADASGGTLTEYGGWFESAYAVWDEAKIGSDVSVSYAPTDSSDFTPADAELIRGNRVDIPGLRGNTDYKLHIEGSAGSAECSIRTMAYDRSGYAHDKYSGIGGYKDDGTLKPDVDILYITNENKDTITYNGKVGLYNIFFSAKPKNVVFRFIGKLDVPAGAVANDGTHNDGSNMLYLQNSSNVTVEGIGPDTDLIEWGIEMKRCTSCEFRNLRLGNYPDDGIAMTGNADIHTEHIWVHNNTIEKGYNAYAGGGHVDADKADGDGSTDMKWAEYITVSYNVYKNCHKTSLVGGRTDQFQDHITYHHNWFDHTASRNPRVRNAHVHSYNNYFLANSEYGICASYNSKIFSENNYFEQTNAPLYAINMGKDQYSGTIKSFGDKFDNCQPDEGLAYRIADSRMESLVIPNLIDGGEAYDNFDQTLYDYTPQTPDEARAAVLAYAGRMKADGLPEQPAESTEAQTTEPASEEAPETETADAPAGISGDLNADGHFDLTDVIMLQKWLLSVPDAHITDDEAADVNKDGKIDIFDLSLLKRNLLQQP